MVIMETTKDVCDNCGDINAECVVLKGIIWFTSYKLCQSCVSKSFRSFVKGK